MSEMQRVQAFQDTRPTTGSVYVMKDYTVNQLRSDLQVILNHWEAKLDQILGKLP